jgi:hypothetical protein
MRTKVVCKSVNKHLRCISPRTSSTTGQASPPRRQECETLATRSTLPGPPCTPEPTLLSPLLLGSLPNLWQHPPVSCGRGAPSRRAVVQSFSKMPRAAEAAIPGRRTAARGAGGGTKAENAKRGNFVLSFGKMRHREVLTPAVGRGFPARAEPEAHRQGQERRPRPPPARPPRRDPQSGPLPFHCLRDQHEHF